MRSVTVDTGGPDDVFPGALVVWLHTPRGGYGYAMTVAARVIHASRKRVRIEVSTRSGRRVERVVLPTSLRWKEPTND